MKIRDAVLAGWDVWQFGSNLERGLTKRVKDLGTMIRWGLFAGRMTHRTKKMNVEELVQKWLSAIVGMATAHDKDTYDHHDAKADELMTPILSAPIKQVREFYKKLRAALRADPRVPMLVWMGFEAWGEVVVKGAEDDEAIKRLKNKLAQEIVELVELEIQDQIPEAIRRALRWRDPETLKEVKEALEGGAKPKLIGRQSCLFLECVKPKKGRKSSDPADRRVQVML